MFASFRPFLRDGWIRVATSSKDHVCFHPFAKPSSLLSNRNKGFLRCAKCTYFSRGDQSARRSFPNPTMNTPRLRRGGDNFFFKFSFTYIGTVEVNDSITVSSAWELTSVSMHYSQGDEVHTPLSRLVLYPRSVCVYVVGVYNCYIGLPSARLGAVEDDNNKDMCVHHLCLQD